DSRTVLQLLLDAFESGYPRVNKVGGVARPEEPLGAAEQPRVVLVPADSLACFESRCDSWLGPHRGERDLERARQEDRSVLVCENKRLLFGQEEPARLRVVARVSAGRLRGKPLAHISFGSAG